MNNVKDEKEKRIFLSQPRFDHSHVSVVDNWGTEKNDSIDVFLGTFFLLFLFFDFCTFFSSVSLVDEIVILII